MATPVRYSSGFTQDQVWQPLAQIGIPNPFFYHVFQDDFNEVDTNRYTTTANTNGTAAATAGDGGLALLTTNSSTPLATDIVQLQGKVASFAFVPATSTVAGKKAVFLTRIQLSSASNAGFIVGLTNTQTTPFVSGITDGLYFSKLTGALNTLNLISMVGSVATTLAIPTSAYTLANATNIDLGFYVDQKGNVFAMVGTNLVGYMPQSGSGATNAVGGIQRQPIAAFSGNPLTLTTANLNPTIAINSGTAASSTMTVDFVLAARER